MIDKRGIRRFVKYFGIGFGTFLVDLALLVSFVAAGVPSVLASGIAFGMAVTLNYFISRNFVFLRTRRDALSGYRNFLFLAAIGACATMFGVYFLVESFSFHYFFARLIVASVVGFTNYLVNLYINFDVAKLD